MRHPSKRFATALVALAAVFVSGCPNPTPNPPASGTQPVPQFSQLHIPMATGGWTSWSPTSPSAEVLPTRGRGVQLWFYAPVGSSFGASLRALDGTITTLPQNSGTPAPPEDGYFQIVSVNAALNPPLYTMYVRAPQALADPANFDVLVVNRSLRNDVTDSAPMVVSLRQQRVFTVTVSVQGGGHVTSSPAGIQCGTSNLGSALTDCSFDFGSGTITLAPGSNSNSKFLGWGGNCIPGVQVCTLTLTGMSAMAAVANFGPSTATVPTSSCPVAPAIPGLKWVDLPDCATGNIAAHPGISHPALCDAQGYFCCEPGPMNVSAPRCGGSGQIKSDADCRHLAPRGMLRQPGGCYEIDSYP